ncbi:hypothetical protein BKA67DRAFT_362704 [Truncatella angustata]|uniref:Uncharacterized protein n=1 Tax=Truncatella angustata TaxID=152316 RepID=A0A9P8UEE7_9PEZI|nr:uncharacterized protein BKA67DRAFT_362704 [Truncatella angustata]KAH6648394.1 hypothetical protein BKA67DRAFT_362704 [Truncatella angustata]KAH8204831.1 hypothetical protein TruAng_001020 [Truncatella angustata]
MDSVSAYSFSSLGWNALQGIPLIIWPQAINGLLAIDSETVGVRPLSDVDNYFARSLGIALLALGAATVVLTGALPLTSMVETTTEGMSPYASAVLLITTLHHGAAAFYCWARYNGTSQTGYLLGFVGSVALAAFGTLTLVFASEKPRLSRRTGADKRTSGWPFPNAEADKRKARKGL